MNNVLVDLLGAGMAGLALGGAYFAALWWTVRRSGAARHPAGLLIGSYLLRAVLLAGGFVRIGGRDWRGWAACLVGVLAARVYACRRVAGAATGGPVSCS